MSEYLIVPAWAYRQLQHARIADEIEHAMPHADRRRIKREIRRACQRYDKLDGYWDKAIRRAAVSSSVPQGSR